MLILLITAAAVVFNIWIILRKYDSGRHVNATLDVILLALVFLAFGGTEMLLIIGTLASAMISLMLTAIPPKFIKDLDNG